LYGRSDTGSNVTYQVGFDVIPHIDLVLGTPAPVSLAAGETAVFRFTAAGSHNLRFGCATGGPPFSWRLYGPEDTQPAQWVGSGACTTAAPIVRVTSGYVIGAVYFLTVTPAAAMNLEMTVQP
jgi:hypothetical protein